MPTRKTRRALMLIVFFGFGLRLAYLAHATSLPGYEWHDPDHYQKKGEMIADGRDGWRFSFDAVRHSSYDHKFYVLPPGYPFFLSLFALFPGYPFTAQVAQVVSSTAAIALLFVVGWQIHSERAGLIAAAIYALWLPNIIAVWSTMQESVYVPLVLLATVALLWSVKGGGQAWRYAIAGLVFGAAALTRSMPMYVLPVVACIFVADKRRHGLFPAVALIAGFFIPTVPYSAALSRHIGRPTFIENHGSIFLVERYGGVEGDAPATLTQTARILVRGFLESPTRALSDWWKTTGSMLHVNGGRLLQIYLGTSTRAGAVVSKLAVHTFGDGLFIATLLLAPFGLALCRRPELASYLLAWIVVNAGLTALSGFGGPRLRAPFAPHMIALAAVVLSGGYRRHRVGWSLAAGAVTLTLAAIVVPQVPRSLASHADYGVDWPLHPPPKRSAMYGRAGFNVLAVGGTVRFHARSRNPGRRTVVKVRLDGTLVETATLSNEEHRFELKASHAGLAYVELTARDARSGDPVRLYIIVPKRS